MSIILSALLLVIFFGVLATLFTEGMWGNAIQFVNMVTAALLATNFYEPLTNWIEAQGDWFKSCTYLWDYLVLWALFATFLIIFRLLTDKISHVKVRFLKLADQIGSVLFACLIGWVFVGFTLFSLHTAPLARNFLFDGFGARKSMFFSVAAPDQTWIKFVRAVSRGAYAKSTEKVFDKYDQFPTNYENRRGEIEKHLADKGAYRVTK